MSIHALDAVLVELAAASTALERTAKPSLKDVKEAKTSAKKAVDLLGAAETFMGYGIYTVTAEPMEPGPALFKPNGDPAVALTPEPEVAEVPPTPTPLDLLRSWEGWNEEERKEHFDAQLVELSRVHQESTGEAEPLDVTPWLEAWNVDPAQAFRWVLFSIAYKNFDNHADTVTAVNEWAENLGKLPALPEELLTWDSRKEDDQENEFCDRLDDLAGEASSSDEDIITNYDPWDTVWGADHKDAFIRLLVAEEREPKTFAVPTDEERDAWLAAHAQPEAPAAEEETAEPSTQLALFEQKLDELEEAGVKESGLKRKNWKKTAAPAWRNAYEADPAGALDKLLWRLQQAQIAWEVPTAEETAA